MPQYAAKSLKEKGGTTAKHTGGSYANIIKSHNPREQEREKQTIQIFSIKAFVLKTSPTFHAIKNSHLCFISHCLR